MAGLPPNLCGRIRYGFDLTGCPVRVWRKVCDMFRLVWLDGVLGWGMGKGWGCRPVDDRLFQGVLV